MSRERRAEREVVGGLASPPCPLCHREGAERREAGEGRAHNLNLD